MLHHQQQLLHRSLPLLALHNVYRKAHLRKIGTLNSCEWHPMQFFGAYRRTTGYRHRRHNISIPNATRATHLAVAVELVSVVPPVGGLPAALRLVVAVALANTAALLAGRGKTASLTVLVNRVGDPVDASIAADGLVVGVDTDDLEVLVHTVLVHPVRVEHTQVGSLATNTLLGENAERAVGLKVVHTLVDGLAVRSTLRSMLLAVATAHANTVDHVALLGLVTHTASLVGARRARGAVDDVQLAVLPAAHTQEEAEDVALLLLVELLEVLVGTHLVR